MFEMLRSQSRSAAGAIMYVTIGTLLMIWSGLWYYFFLMRDPNPSPEQSFACIGMILSGLAIAVIGLLFGLIGRGAKAADHTVGVAPAATVSPAVPAAAATDGVLGTAAVGAPVVAAAPTAIPVAMSPRVASVNSARR